MFADNDRFLKFFILVVFLGSLVGFLFNYYSGSPKSGFVSPVVFGKGSAYKVKSPSPFSNLFDKLVPQSSRSSQYPVSGSSYLARSDTKTGAILGETTTSVNRDSLSNSDQGRNNINSGTSNSSTSTSAVSSTSTASSTSVTSSVSNNDSGNSIVDSTSQTQANTTATVLTGSQQAVEDVTNLVSGYLKSQNYVALYNLMSSDFKNTFSLEDFVSSFSGSPTITVSNITATPKIYGANNEWAEQSIRLTLADGSVQNYLNIYHLEGTVINSAWALFATQDQ